MTSRFVYSLSVISLHMVLLVPANAQLSLEVANSHPHDGAARVQATGAPASPADTEITLTPNAPADYTRVVPLLWNSGTTFQTRLVPGQYTRN